MFPLPIHTREDVAIQSRPQGDGIAEQENRKEMALHNTHNCRDVPVARGRKRLIAKPTSQSDVPTPSAHYLFAANVVHGANSEAIRIA